ncbi:Hypothetical predicted protein [Mytilus galloprovincialis]|uniref:Uncharacterized protein n=1 Tax=Mytilus galloprovincialis TaxID=29158 RepID=A0A8B6DPD7_MYTGA|nr:Hypothetical predicted protein [Mytilus galloprovincialis]
MALPKLIRKTQVRFSAKDDLNLLKEVLAENPYMDKTKWEVVAQNVKENVNKVFNVTSRRVRERTQLLLQQFQKENYEALKSTTSEKSHFLQYLKKVTRTTIKFLSMIQNQMWTTLKKRTMLLTPQNVLVFFKGQPAGVGEQSGSALNSTNLQHKQPASESLYDW